MTVPTLLVTGPVGVGKTTTAIEISHQLAAARVAHALVDLDELDRIYPPPADDPDKRTLTQRNLEAVWANLRQAGAARLILVGVLEDLDLELVPIRAAVPGASVVIVRLQAAVDDLVERIARREVGSAREYHVRRASEQAASMAASAAGNCLFVDTASRPVQDVAHEILVRVGWHPENPLLTEAFARGA